MMPYLTEEYGNAGTLYGLGRKAHMAVEHAREQVARCINAEPEQIIFTSGGSEANSLVFRGLYDYCMRHVGEPGSLYMSPFEHESLMRSAQYLYSCGVDWNTFNPVDGLTDTDYNMDLVSCMFENNETGDRYNVYAIASQAHERGALFHTDCVQALYTGDVDVGEIGCDFMSISSHKIHGPKGVGALYARDKTVLDPLIFGGSVQEFGLRGGTENVAGIVGFGKACELLHFTNLMSWCSWVFRNTLEEDLRRSGLLDRLRYNSKGFGKITNLRFNGIDAETLVLAMDSRGVCISAGSACTSHESNPSHVLRAIGLTDEQARSSVRVSFSRMNTEAEAEEAAHIMAACVKELI